MTSRPAPSDSLLPGSGLAGESSPGVTGVRVFEPRRLTSLHQVSPADQVSPTGEAPRPGRAEPGKELGPGGRRSRAPKLSLSLRQTYLHLKT